MKKAFFKVCIVQSGKSVSLDIPATETRLFQLVYDCLTSSAIVEIQDIHEKELHDQLDNSSYGD